MLILFITAGDITSVHNCLVVTVNGSKSLNIVIIGKQKIINATVRTVISFKFEWKTSSRSLLEVVTGQLLLSYN